MSNGVTTYVMNEAIAWFMGINPIPVGTKRLGDIKPPEESIVFLNYHDKWELLMPVVEKIEAVFLDDKRRVVVKSQRQCADILSGMYNNIRAG